MSNWRRRWLVGRLIPALAVVAVAAPTAGAYPLEEGGATSEPTVGVARVSTEATANPLQYRIQRQIAGENVPSAVDANPAAQPGIPSDGFDWPPVELVVGAAALAALLTGALTATRRRRTQLART